MDDVLDPSWMRLEGDFEGQVQSLFSYVRLSRDEVEGLHFLFRDVEDTLRIKWPGCEVIPFGSIVTGMGIRTSDVDCYVHIPPWYKRPGDKMVNTARNILRRRSHIFAQLFSIATAKVPIVKFYHVPTRRNCDLSFKSPNGVRNSKLICYLLHLDKRAQDLAILVKYWSKVHHLTGTNLMPNYALTLLVIFYLQHIDILPSVLALQEIPSHDPVDGWNTAFEECHHPNDNYSSLHDVVGGFFSFYSTFRFDENIISPFLGYPIVRESFKKLTDVPDAFQLYKDNLSNKLCMPLKVDTAMCVQDPFDHSRNCTVGVFPKLAQKMCEFFRLAAKVYEKETNENFLKVLLSAQPQTVPAAVGKKPKIQNKVVKPRRPDQNFKNMKKNLQNNLHAMFAHINSKQRGKR
ncbi:speckle targeted PIP5K1A-regulated poly(A) polymerase-like isoform X2 [Choristoneura fumiferana]